MIDTVTFSEYLSQQTQLQKYGYHYISIVTEYVLINIVFYFIFIYSFF